MSGWLGRLESPAPGNGGASPGDVRVDAVAECPPCWHRGADRHQDAVEDGPSSKHWGGLLAPPKAGQARKRFNALDSHCNSERFNTGRGTRTMTSAVFDGLAACERACGTLKSKADGRHAHLELACLPSKSQ